MMAFLKLMGIGGLALIAVIVFFNYNRSEEYPLLQNRDSLNDMVQGVFTDRSISFVTFSNKKYRFPWAKNFNYEDFPSLSEIISSGDMLFKKPFSDTVVVAHKGNEYVYVLGQTIQK